MSCNCNTTTYYPWTPTSIPCNPCITTTSCDSSSSPCPTQLDSQCVIYHKFNSSSSALTNLGISNGATLELILETIDPYIAQLKVSTFTLTYLRTLYVVNTLKQFAEAVDTELGLINSALTTDDDVVVPSGWLGNLSSDPGAATDGYYWFNTNSGELKIKANGVVKVITTS